MVVKAVRNKKWFPTSDSDFNINSIRKGKEKSRSAVEAPPLLGSTQALALDPALRRDQYNCRALL